MINEKKASLILRTNQLVGKIREDLEDIYKNYWELVSEQEKQLFSEYFQHPEGALEESLENYTLEDLTNYHQDLIILNLKLGEGWIDDLIETEKELKNG